MAAFNRYGIPDELLTDNGKQFAARFNPGGGETLFDRICRENGIVHHLTKPRSPTTTGKIERFHQTLQNELLNESTQRARQAGGRRDGAALECRLLRPQPGLSRPPGAGLMITAQSRDRGGSLGGVPPSRPARSTGTQSKAEEPLPNHKINNPSTPRT